MNDRSDPSDRKIVRERLAQRAAERIEEMQRREIARPQPDTDAYPGPRSPAATARRDRTSRESLQAYAALAVVALGLCGGVFAIGKAVIDGLKDRAGGVGRLHVSGSETVGRTFNESEAVTLCDLNMQSLAVSRSSYRSAWSWRKDEADGVVAIRRDFTVKNSLGVELSGTYTCLVGGTTNRIAGLQYELAGVVSTVPGADLTH